MHDYNGNGVTDKEDYTLHEQLINEQEQMAKEAKHHSFWEYIGAFVILMLIFKLVQLFFV